MRNIIVLALLTITTVPVVQAADIPPSCLVSFNVKDTSFTSGGATMSCMAVEVRREELFRQINALPTTGTVVGKDLANRLASMEAELKKQEDATNSGGMADALTANFIATLGMAACMETLGGGCGVAAAAKIYELYKLVDGAATDAKKKAAAAKMRAQVAAIRVSITPKVTAADKLRTRMIEDFNGLCNDVQKYCLK